MTGPDPKATSDQRSASVIDNVSGAQMLLFQSDRHFVLASYAASHGILLFSSRKTNDQPTRIDLLFQDVRAMELRNWFHGLSVFRAEVAYLEGRRSAPQSLIEPGNVVYALRGGGWDG